MRSTCLLGRYFFQNQPFPSLHLINACDGYALGGGDGYIDVDINVADYGDSDGDGELN